MLFEFSLSFLIFLSSEVVNYWESRIAILSGDEYVHLF